jgi:hypothetical protein
VEVVEHLDAREYDYRQACRAIRSLQGVWRLSRQGGPSPGPIEFAAEFTDPYLVSRGVFRLNVVASSGSHWRLLNWSREMSSGEVAAFAGCSPGSLTGSRETWFTLAKGRCAVVELRNDDADEPPVLVVQDA